jgi:hypothetical protein
MKKSRLLLLPLLLLLLLPITLNGCATPGGGQTSAAQVSANSLIAMGDAIKQTPATADALFSAGKITKAQYNQIAMAYTQAQAAYIVAVDAEEAYIKAADSPDKATAYRTAFDQAVKSLGDLQALVKSFQ